MVLAQVMEKPSIYKVSPVNQDDLWKKVIADLFEEFLLFFLPNFHEEVDFSKPIDFLQQELFKEIIEERKGRKVTDQIAKVQLKDGKEQWVLVHTEVQTKDSEDFAKRMFEYFYRIFDRHGKNIIAIAIFTDTSDKSTNVYEYVYFGTRLSYTFNKYVLSDFDEIQLKSSKKLFSRAILAAIYLNKTKKNANHRKDLKSLLMKELVKIRSDNVVTNMEIQALCYFVDYLLVLPKDLSNQFVQEIRPIIQKEGKHMLNYNKDGMSPTFAELMDLERKIGIENGIEQIVIGMLKKELPIDLIAEVSGLTEEEIEAIRIKL